MPAYYVDSGQLHCKIIADTPTDAYTKAFNNIQSKQVKLGLITSISEHGVTIKDETFIIPTSNILNQLGMEDEFYVDPQAVDQLMKELGLDNEDDSEDWKLK